MKKIGILGGSFNPIHNGHIALANAAYKEFKLDKVIFIPSGCSYLKKDINMPSGQLRLSLVELGISEYNQFESSDIEILRPGNTYTVDTMNELSSIYKDSELFFIAGADTLFSLENWYKAQELFNITTFIISVRNGISIDNLKLKADELTAKFGAKILFLNSPNIEVSSSQIRELIHDSKNYKEYLPIGVYNYIKSHEIYI